MNLRNQWPSKKELSGDSFCVDARGEHIQLTIPHLEEWAKRIIRFLSSFNDNINTLLQNTSGDQVKVNRYPPDDILDQWNISKNNIIPRPRGRCGPYPQLPPSNPGPTTDSAQLSLATAGLLTVITDSISRRRSPSPQRPRKRPHSPSPSPPPSVDTELRVFLSKLLQKIRRLPDMERVYQVLDQEGYTSEALASERLNTGQIAELTQLPDGATLSMQTFAHEWCENNRAKKRVSQK